jgi:hypothetical protein
MGQDKMKEDCKKGNHDFIEIMRIGNEWDETTPDKIVKWCRYCGGIKINIEMDGRVIGHSMKFRLPKILEDENL